MRLKYKDNIHPVHLDTQTIDRLLTSWCTINSIDKPVSYRKSDIDLQLLFPNHNQDNFKGRSGIRCLCLALKQEQLAGRI